MLGSFSGGRQVKTRCGHTAVETASRKAVIAIHYVPNRLPNHRLARSGLSVGSAAMVSFDAAPAIGEEHNHDQAPVTPQAQQR